MRGRLLPVIVLEIAAALVGQDGPGSYKLTFLSAEVDSATDFPIPIAGGGTVVLDVLVTENGEVQRIEVRRDIALLTPLAVRTVSDWKFSPAMRYDKPCTSRVPVAVTFRPPGYAAAVPFPDLVRQTEAAIQAEFQPAGVTRAAFPKYPETTVAAGTVVLELNVNEKGIAGKDIKVVRDLPPLTEEAKAAVEDFRFMAATLNGKPVESKVVLAFVFQPRPPLLR